MSYKEFLEKLMEEIAYAVGGIEWGEHLEEIHTSIKEFLNNRQD